VHTCTRAHAHTRAHTRAHTHTHVHTHIRTHTYTLVHRYVKMGDKEVEYNKNFRLFLHTKLSNPHYPPEIQAETTLINFTVTEKVGHTNKHTLK